MTILTRLLILTVLAIGLVGCPARPKQDNRIGSITTGNGSPVTIGTGGSGVGTAPCAGNVTTGGTGSKDTAAGSTANTPNCSPPPANIIVTPPGSTTEVAEKKKIAQTVTGTGAADSVAPSLVELFK